MQKKLKIPDEFVRDKYAGLRFLANWLNPLSRAAGPIRPVLRKIELIVESMTGLPPIKKHGEAPERAWFDYQLTPAERRAAASPAFAVELFNEMVEEYPVPLKLAVRKKGGGVEVSHDRSELNLVQRTLLLLWESYFKDEGWQRLKRCPTCEKWFVDDTRNKSKERCSGSCTWNWWTRSRRKEAGHGKQKIQKKKR
jgi:hypothetical protein